MRFTLVYVSGDRRRVELRTIETVDIDAAARMGVDVDRMYGWFGGSASWFLAAVVQEDLLAETAAALEGEL